MNKIEKLIKELCPNGVEYKSLDDLCEIKKGQQLNKENFKSIDGGYPVINGGQAPSGYWREYNFNEDTITMSQCGASAGYVDIQKSKFWAGAHCYTFIPKSEGLNNKFLFFNLKNLEKRFMELQYGAGIPAIDLKKLKNIQIPIPPLEIQNQIVNILDKFTELTTELTHRDKQYNYYRNKLLNFDNNKELLNKIMNNQQCSNNIVEYKRLWEIANYENGKSHEQFTNNYGKFILINSKFISTEGKNIKKVSVRLTPIEKENIALVLSDLPDGKALAKCYFIESNNIFTVNQRICKLSVKNDNLVKSKYLFYLLDRNKQLLKYDNKISQTNLSKEQILNLQIPLPHISIQNKIVEILDKLETYTKDIQSGLPLEIDQRKKQYEYYRDKLLDFKDLAGGGIK